MSEVVKTALNILEMAQSRREMIDRITNSDFNHSFLLVDVDKDFSRTWYWNGPLGEPMWTLFLQRLADTFYKSVLGLSDG